jgi:hypothetical protein
MELQLAADRDEQNRPRNDAIELLPWPAHLRPGEDHGESVVFEKSLMVVTRRGRRFTGC